MTRFAPVELDKPLGNKASQTFLRHYERCPRAGYFYAQHKGAVQTSYMVRGSAFHRVVQLGIEAMIEQGECSMPGELIKTIVSEVFADMHVAFDEHDYVRESAYRWAGETMIDPANVIACERLIVLEIEGWQVRCKIDFAEQRDQGLVVRVEDYKSSRAAPAFDEIARTRPGDRTLAAKNFQLILYALALQYGRPVSIEECDQCEGGGQVADVDGMADCPTCNGRGYLEVVEPLPLAARAERFELEFVYPGIEDKEGMMVRRPVSLTRFELSEYMESLRALLKRVERSEQTGDWPAILSKDACKECPCKPSCPIPLELRDYAGEINTVEQAAQASEVLDRQTANNQALREELKRFAKAKNVDIRYGRDKVWRFIVATVERTADKDAMWAAVQEATDFGKPFDRARFVKVGTSTNFTAITLTAEEIAAEQAVSRETEEEAEDGR